MLMCATIEDLATHVARELHVYKHVSSLSILSSTIPVIDGTINYMTHIDELGSIGPKSAVGRIHGRNAYLRSIRSALMSPNELGRPLMPFTKGSVVDSYSLANRSLNIVENIW